MSRSSSAIRSLLWFANSLHRGARPTAIALPLATAMAYAFARFNTGGPVLRLGVLASQMLPPIILVLPLFGMFLLAGLMQSRTAIVIAHLTIRAAVPRLDAGGLLRGRRRSGWRRRRGSMARPAGRPSA